MPHNPETHSPQHFAHLAPSPAKVVGEGSVVRSGLVDILEEVRRPASPRKCEAVDLRLALDEDENRIKLVPIVRSLSGLVDGDVSFSFTPAAAVRFSAVLVSMAKTRLFDQPFPWEVDAIDRDPAVPESADKEPDDKVESADDGNDDASAREAISVSRVDVRGEDGSRFLVLTPRVSKGSLVRPVVLRTYWIEAYRAAVLAVEILDAIEKYTEAQFSLSREAEEYGRFSVFDEESNTTEAS